MSQEPFRLSGKITHVFGHRFVVETPKGAVLADVTPHGAAIVKLRIGAEVELEGERKPSELQGRALHLKWPRDRQKKVKAVLCG